MARQECIALLYDNDKDHLDFLREWVRKLPQLKPKVLIQTKLDLQTTDSRHFQDAFAKELGGLKIYKQVSRGQTTEATEAILQVCMDPSKGLTEESLEIAKSQQDSSWLEDRLGLTGPQLTLLAGVAGAGLVYLARKKWI